MRKERLLTSVIAAVLALQALAADTASDRMALSDSIQRLVTGAEVSSHEVLLSRFGARGDSATDCHPAFVRAMKYARRRGGARIVLTPGVWLCKGAIHLADNVTLDIREGATLRFVAQPSAFLPMVETSWEGTFLWNYSPFIYGRGLHDVAILGKGTIDGDAGQTFATWKEQQQTDQAQSRLYNHQGIPVAQRRFGQGHFLRPQLVQFYECSRVTIADVFIRRAPFWCFHLLRSENILMQGIRYDAKLVNNDGIDIESSRNVLIEDIYFDNGDDNIAIKSGRDNDGWTMSGPSENILIRRCHFKGLHAVVIGSEMSGGVRNMVVSDCDNSGYCKRGIFVKTNPDRGGFVKRIYINNVRFGEVLDLFYVTSMYAGQGLGSHHFADISDIHVDGLTARKVSGTALVLQGTEASPLRGISFRRVVAGEVRHGLSFENTAPVTIEDCHLGERVGVPTQVSAADKIFEQNNK